MPKRKRSQPALQMLPNEHLRSIAAYLDWESARNFGLVNKQFYNIALSRVYKSFRSDHPLSSFAPSHSQHHIDSPS